MPELRVSGIVEESITDGPGLRYVVFTQGCPHTCKGCHNPETHSLDGGRLMDTRAILDSFRENPLLAGITFSGGEPFLQPDALCSLAEQVKALGKTVFTYTGYTFEHLYSLGERNRAITSLLALTDILVDGPYIEELRDLDLPFRGSSNQRMLTFPDRRSLTGKKTLRI